MLLSVGKNKTKQGNYTMKVNSLLATAALIGTITVGNIAYQVTNPSLQASAAQQVKQQVKQEKKDATGLTVQQKIDMLTKNKGQFGSGDQLRRYFFGDLEPIGIQPGGAGMVVNLYNKANNYTFSYCSTFDVIVAVKQGKVKAFAPAEVK
jgi:hypothetical protein